MPARELRRHVHLGCTGVAMDVGQGLLGDAQDRPLNVWRNAVHGAGDPHGCPEAGPSRKAVAELLERRAQPILGEVGRVKQVGEDA